MVDLQRTPRRERDHCNAPLAIPRHASYISLMSTQSPAASERALKAQERRAEAEKAIAEHRAREEAIDRKTERLRALRLAHEAQNPPLKVQPKAKPAKRR